MESRPTMQGGELPKLAEDGQHQEESNERQLEEMIEKLAVKTSAWLLGEPLYNYQGFWHTADVLKLIISAQQKFQAEPTDLFLCSSPKTGTTWLKALAFAIATRKTFGISTNPLLTNGPHDCVPFLELNLTQILNDRKNSDSLPLYSTHMPYSSLPESIISSNCKIVYIYREPKDVVISFWQFISNAFSVPKEAMPLEIVCEEFCQGLSSYGPYWEHILGYWKASFERPEKVLILKYEDLKKDTFGNLKRLAEFMGYPFSLEEEGEGVVESIAKLCSFENLSNLEVNKSGKYHSEQQFLLQNHVFFRKAKVGGWNDYLTSEMKDKIDQIMEQKLSGSGVTFASTPQDQ